jgi:hypothetical protein
MRLKTCKGCNEQWPPDTEFYETPEADRCIACEKEKPYWKKLRSSEAIERRKAYQRERWHKVGKEKRR